MLIGTWHLFPSSCILPCIPGIGRQKILFTRLPCNSGCGFASRRQLHEMWQKGLSYVSVIPPSKFLELCVLVTTVVFWNSRLQLWLCDFKTKSPVGPSAFPSLKPSKDFVCTLLLHLHPLWVRCVEQFLFSVTQPDRSTESNVGFVGAWCTEPHVLLLISIRHQPQDGKGQQQQGCRAKRAQNTGSNFQAWILVPPLTTYLTLDKVLHLFGFLFPQCKNGLVVSNSK